MDIIEITSFDKLEQFAERWNELLAKSSNNIVFMTYEYCLSWWRTFKTNYDLIVLIAKKQNQIVGIAPFVITKTKEVRILGSGQSDYMDLIIASDHMQVLKAFFEYMFSIRNRWEKIRLMQIPILSPVFSNAPGYLNPLGLKFSLRNGHPCMALQIAGRTESVKEKIRKQKTLKYAAKKLGQQGNLTYERIESIPQANIYLDKYFQQHISRWDGTVTLSTYYNEAPRRFYRELVNNLLEKGWLHFTHLSLDGNPIAINFSFLYNNSLAVHRTSYDLWYWKHSPGRLIYRYATQYCLDHDLNDFDLLAGLDSYKGYLITEARLTKEIHIFKSNRIKYLDELKFRLKKSGLFRPFFKDSKIWRLRMKIRKQLRLNGKAGTLKKLLHRLTAPLFEISRMDFYKYDGRKNQDIKSACWLDIRTGSEADLPFIAGFHGFAPELPEVEEIQTRFKNGEIPYLAISGKTVVHISWVVKKELINLEELWGQINIGPKSAYIYDCKTIHTFRGKGIYPAVLTKIVEDLKQEGIKNIFIASRRANYTSVNGIIKAGFYKLKSFKACKILGKKLGTSSYSLT